MPDFYDDDHEITPCQDCGWDDPDELNLVTFHGSNLVLCDECKPSDTESIANQPDTRNADLEVID